MDIPDLLETCRLSIRRAGAAVMDIYQSGDLDVQTKQDSSPVTRADLLASTLITADLESVSSIPVISEESEVRPLDARTYRLVDPLDGTKEFIAHNGEFTINIGLIQDGTPVMGLIYAPAKDVLYFGSETGAYKQSSGKQPQRLNAQFQGDVPVAAVSRSHRNADTQKFLESLGDHTEIAMGSSLKFCLVAEGTASIYPRLGPTMLWDTAAADAIVRAAGGTIHTLDNRQLSYTLTPNMSNPSFVVRSAP